jgi:PBSX family phage terminase large subunit
MEKLINKNLAALVYYYKKGYRGVVLEGSSRSGKTFAGVDFQIKLASETKDKLVINNVRETYNSFKTTLFDDYDTRLNQLGLYSPFCNKDVQTFNLLGNKVNFIGADKIGKVHGAGSDFFFINEALEGIDRQFFDQLEQRCKKFWWMDYNPSASDHWIFDLEKRPDVKFVRSTLLDNPFIPKYQKIKILSYDPNNEQNIINGTADDYMWKVYGLGLRASPEGLIFNNVTLIDNLPENYDAEYWGIDFGFTQDPTAIVQVRKVGNNLYAKLHCYTPIDNAILLSQVIDKIGKNNVYWCDSSDGEQGMITSLRRLGYSTFAVRKYPGSIKTGIDILKRYKLHVVRDVNAEKEINNYKWRTINGISLNEPIDKFNHFWDGFRYAVMSNLI